MTKRVILFKLLGRGNVFAMGRRASLRCLKYYTYEGVLLIYPRMYFFFISCDVAWALARYPDLPDHMDLEDDQDYICFIPDEFNS